MRVNLVALVSVVLMGLSSPSLAQSKGGQATAAPTGQDRTSAFMRVYGPTDPPYAFWRFCDEFPADCAKKRVIDARW